MDHYITCSQSAQQKATYPIFSSEIYDHVAFISRSVFILHIHTCEYSLWFKMMLPLLVERADGADRLMFFKTGKLIQTPTGRQNEEGRENFLFINCHKHFGTFSLFPGQNPHFTKLSQVYLLSTIL